METVRAREMPMRLKEELAAERERWGFSSFYQKFEHAVILVLTALIAVVVAFAVWNLVLKVVLSIVSVNGFDPTDYEVFQALFGMIFTVIIALEFKRSLLVVAERRHGVAPQLVSTDRNPARSRGGSARRLWELTPVKATPGDRRKTFKGSDHDRTAPGSPASNFGGHPYEFDWPGSVRRNAS
jgi:hypothetical protein